MSDSDSPATSDSSDAPEGPGAPAGQRLQKVLAAAGVGSRRKCEELILAGRVEVDGRVTTELGQRVDPDRQRIAVDTIPIRRAALVYYLLNKPTGVVCTNHDPSGRQRVIDLLPPTAGRVFTVGRLDRNSEGAVLLTNDGELAEKLMHPRFEVPKLYEVQVVGEPTPEVFKQLKRGVHLAEGMARASEVKLKSRHGRSCVLQITLKEGRNREVRRLLARVGHKVMRLRRVAIGPLRLKDLPLGEFRKLHEAEVRELRKASILESRRRSPHVIVESSEIDDAPATSPPPREKRPPRSKPLRGRPVRGAGGKPRREPRGAPQPTEGEHAAAPARRFSAGKPGKGKFGKRPFGKGKFGEGKFGAAKFGKGKFRDAESGDARPRRPPGGSEGEAESGARAPGKPPKFRPGKRRPRPGGAPQGAARQGSSRPSAAPPGEGGRPKRRVKPSAGPGGKRPPRPRPATGDAPAPRGQRPGKRKPPKGPFRPKRRKPDEGPPP